MEAAHDITELPKNRWMPSGNQELFDLFEDELMSLEDEFPEHENGRLYGSISLEALEVEHREHTVSPIEALDLGVERFRSYRARSEYGEKTFFTVKIHEHKSQPYYRATVQHIPLDESDETLWELSMDTLHDIGRYSAGENYKRLDGSMKSDKRRHFFNDLD